MVKVLQDLIEKNPEGLKMNEITVKAADVSVSSKLLSLRLFAREYMGEVAGSVYLAEAPAKRKRT